MYDFTTSLINANAKFWSCILVWNLANSALGLLGDSSSLPGSMAAHLPRHSAYSLCAFMSASLQPFRSCDNENQYIRSGGYRKVPKFSDTRNSVVIHLKFKQRPNLKECCQKYANELANSENPDQTAPLGAV